MIIEMGIQIATFLAEWIGCRPWGSIILLAGLYVGLSMVNALRGPGTRCNY